MSYLLARYSYSSHYIKPSNACVHTFFIGTKPYSLVWSYDLVGSKTGGIIIACRKLHHAGVEGILRVFEILLRAYKQHTFRPLFPTYITGSHMMSLLGLDTVR